MNKLQTLRTSLWTILTLFLIVREPNTNMYQHPVQKIATKKIHFYLETFEEAALKLHWKSTYITLFYSDHDLASSGKQLKGHLRYHWILAQPQDLWFWLANEQPQNAMEPHFGLMIIKCSSLAFFFTRWLATVGKIAKPTNFFHDLVQILLMQLTSYFTRTKPCFFCKWNHVFALFVG